MAEPTDLTQRDEGGESLEQARADYAAAQELREAQSNRSTDHLGYPRTGGAK